MYRARYDIVRFSAKIFRLHSGKLAGWLDRAGDRGSFFQHSVLGSYSSSQPAKLVTRSRRLSTLLSAVPAARAPRPVPAPVARVRGRTRCWREAKIMCEFHARCAGLWRLELNLRAICPPTNHLHMYEYVQLSRRSRALQHARCSNVDDMQHAARSTASRCARAASVRSISCTAHPWCTVPSPLSEDLAVPAARFAGCGSRARWPAPARCSLLSPE